MPILVWVILGIFAFNVLFVAVRIRATRPHAPRGPARQTFAYATIHSPRQTLQRRQR